MTINKIRTSELPKWMREKPCMARVYAILFMIAAPIVFPAVAVWEAKDDLATAFSQAIRTAFLPWEDNE